MQIAAIKATSTPRLFNQATTSTLRPAPSDLIDRRAAPARARLATANAPTPPSARGVSTRDPFAALGAQSTWATFGTDGPIPADKRATCDQAMKLALALRDDPTFIAKFNSAIATATEQQPSPDLYRTTLARVRLNVAESSRTVEVQQALESEREARRVDPSFQESGAFSKVSDPTGNIWVRQRTLNEGARGVALSILHEVAHLAGVPRHGLAELMVMPAIHAASGLDRNYAK